MSCRLIDDIFLCEKVRKGYFSIGNLIVRLDKCHESISPQNDLLIWIDMYSFNLTLDADIALNVGQLLEIKNLEIVFLVNVINLQLRGRRGVNERQLKVQRILFGMQV